MKIYFCLFFFLMALNPVAQANFGYEQTIDCTDTTQNYLVKAGSHNAIFVDVVDATPTTLTFKIVPALSVKTCEVQDGSVGVLFDHILFEMNDTDSLFIPGSGVTTQYRVNKKQDGQILLTVTGLKPGKNYYLRAHIVRKNGSKAGMISRALGGRVEFSTPFNPVTITSLDSDCIHWKNTPEAFVSPKGIRYFVSFYDASHQFIRMEQTGSVYRAHADFSTFSFCRKDLNGAYDKVLNQINTGTLYVVVSTAPNTISHHQFMTHDAVKVDVVAKQVTSFEPLNFKMASTDLVLCAQKVNYRYNMCAGPLMAGFIPPQ